MKRGGVVLLVALGVYTTSTQAADWTPVAEKLAQSVVYVENAEGSCTGFVVNAHAKGDKDLVLTAAHCDGDKLFADHAAARVVFKDGKHDLMLLEVDDLDRPAVTFAARNPAQGDEVASFGFGYALDKPILRIAHVSNPSIQVPDVDGGPLVMIDAGYVPGQSGGPCVNAAGEVVSIVQRANGLVGIGQGAEEIRSRVKRYLEKPAKP
jgi:S1-C subfamily serine protease